MKVSCWHRSSRGRSFGAVALLSLLLLFLIGPLHVWHHTDESLLGPDGKCLPCSTFHKTLCVQTAEASDLWTQPFAGFVELAVDDHVESVELSATASRAPPLSPN